MYISAGLGYETNETINYQISQMQADHEFRRQNPNAQKILDDPNSSFAEKTAVWEAKHKVDKKYGLADANSEALLYMLKNDTYVDSDGALKFRQGSSYSQKDLKLIGVNLSDEGGLIIDGKTLATVKGHENYESKNWHLDEATAHEKASAAGEYAGSNHSWANFINGLGGDYKAVTADDWLKNNNGDLNLAINNLTYQLLGASQTRNYDSLSISVETALIDDPELGNVKRVASQMVAQAAIISGAAGTEMSSEDVNAILASSGLDFSKEEREEYDTEAKALYKAAALASPLKKLVTLLSVSKKVLSFGKDSNPTADSVKEWNKVSSKPKEKSSEQKIPTKIDGATVVDKDTGKTYHGTVDIEPTLTRIKDGGSYPHANDGTIFRNDKTKLPAKTEGYYKEYVHPTPGFNGVGPQRIVTGKNGEIYYTPDHYETFTPIK